MISFWIILFFSTLPMSKSGLSIMYWRGVVHLCLCHLIGTIVTFQQTTNKLSPCSASSFDNISTGFQHLYFKDPKSWSSDNASVNMGLLPSLPELYCGKLMLYSHDIVGIVWPMKSWFTNSYSIHKNHCHKCIKQQQFIMSQTKINMTKHTVLERLTSRPIIFTRTSIT